MAEQSRENKGSAEAYFKKKYTHPSRTHPFPRTLRDKVSNGQFAKAKESCFLDVQVEGGGLPFLSHFSAIFRIYKQWGCE